MNLYLLQYNNYYNRIVKRLNTIEEYESFILEGFENINFNPNDGIVTEQIINYEGDMPDYCIVCSDTGEINSRWFVVESQRTRSQQFKLSLIRDVIADWYDEVISAPCFIEKAQLDKSSALIFNKENFSCNQIKTWEKPITDTSNTPWFCAYINKDLGNITVNIPSADYTPDLTVSSIEAYTNYRYVTESFTGDYVEDCLVSIKYRDCLDLSSTPCTMKFTYDLINESPQYSYDGTKTYPYAELFNNSTLPEGVTLTSLTNETNSYEYTEKAGSTFVNIPNTMNELSAAYRKSTYDFINATRPYTGSNTEITIQDDNGIIILDQTTAKYYKVSVVRRPDIKIENREVPANSALGFQLQAIAGSIGQAAEIEGSPFTVSCKASQWGIVLTELASAAVSITIPSGRRHCEDAPYDLIMIPRDIITVSGNTAENTNAALCENFINSLQLAQGVSEQDLYDIQLLPYYPEPQRFRINEGSEIKSTLNTAQLTSGLDYIFSNGVLIMFPQFSNFSFRETRESLKITVPNNPVEFKIANECDTYRLCSPNFNGQFEFSVAKNYGVPFWNITCSYKPYTPYIKVSPYFQALYGTDFDDARGLVCGGDFSLSQITSEWQTYERNNKNYQVIFNREIENMEVNNSIARSLEKWNVATGVVSAASTGAMGGMMMGGGIGAGIGGAAMGAASLVGGIADITYNEKLREEALDYKQDLFGYQLGTIKALPYNLTKVSARNADNKVFPFVEYYTCTDAEKDALRNKIKYNGMTVMAISSISAYIKEEPTYIKGKLIRLEVKDDYHVANVIADEINKGVFI